MITRVWLLARLVACRILLVLASSCVQYSSSTFNTPDHEIHCTTSPCFSPPATMMQQSVGKRSPTFSRTYLVTKSSRAALFSLPSIVAYSFIRHSIAYGSVPPSPRAHINAPQTVIFSCRSFAENTLWPVFNILQFCWCVLWSSGLLLGRDIQDWTLSCVQSREPCSL